MPRPEVHCVDAVVREVRDVRPRLLPLHHEPTACCPQRREQRVLGDDAARGRVADDRRLGLRRQEGAQLLLCFLPCAIGRVPEVHRRRRLARDDVVGDTRVELGHRQRLDEPQAIHEHLAWLVSEERLEPTHGSHERAVGFPGPGGVAAPTSEREPDDEVSEAAGVDLAVGGLEQDGKRRLMDRLRGGEEPGQRIVLVRELLASEEEESDVEPGVRSGVTNDLERDR